MPPTGSHGSNVTLSDELAIRSDTHRRRSARGVAARSACSFFSQYIEAGPRPRCSPEPREVAKLALAPSDTDNRRVITAIKYLES